MLKDLLNFLFVLLLLLWGFLLLNEFILNGWLLLQEFFRQNCFNFGKYFFEVVLASIFCKIFETDFSNIIFLFFVRSFWVDWIKSSLRLWFDFSTFFSFSFFLSVFSMLFEEFTVISKDILWYNFPKISLSFLIFFVSFDLIFLISFSSSVSSSFT